MPSSASSQWMSTLLGPSTDSPRPPYPALRVSTTKCASWKVRPSLSPAPHTFTLSALPISDGPTTILKGLLVTCCPPFRTLTTCSPTSFGVKEIPMCRLGRRLSRHGSSLPDGARMDAVSWLRSVSEIFRETSVAVPTFS